MGGKAKVTRCQWEGCANSARGKYCSSHYRKLAADKPKRKSEIPTGQTPAPAVTSYLGAFERVYRDWRWVGGKLRRR